MAITLILWFMFGQPFNAEGLGGLALFGNKYSDLENADNKLSFFYWIRNK